MNLTDHPADEPRIREALRDATVELTAPVQRLTAAASHDGRRLRTRRRVGAAGLTLCAVAAVAVPVALAMGPDPAKEADVATDPSVPLPDPRPVDGQGGWWDMPASQMLQRLEDATPDGRSYADPVLTNKGENGPGEPVAELRGWLGADVLADGATAGGINVVLYAPGQDAERYTCPGNLEAPDRCTEITDDAGEVVGRTSVSKTGPVSVREVVLLREDGGVVYVAASNSADDKWGAASTPASDQVPFTMAELVDVAGDATWTTYQPR